MVTDYKNHFNKYAECLHSLPKFQGPFTPTSERCEKACAVPAGIFWVPLWFWVLEERERGSLFVQFVL